MTKPSGSSNRNVASFYSLAEQLIASILPNQRHSITIIKTNWRHNATNTTTPWLSGHAGRHGTLLPRLWHGASSTQQCQLLKLAKGTKSSRGALLFLSNTTVPPNNGAVLNIAHIIKNIMSSATKVELSGLYTMAHEAVYIRIIQEELGHMQPSTP